MDQLSLSKFEPERALNMSLSVAAAPLWLAYAGAGAAGAAYYWMNRWRATNLEALTGLFDQSMAPMARFAVATAEVVEDIAEPLIEALPEPVIEVIAAVMPEPTAESAPEPEPEPEPEPDDLTVLTGIGPKLSASLAERGITRFEHLAKLTPKKIARLDKQMKLMGRIDRDAWVAQAKRLMG
jgi:predicted flap endonuclease-1-like 5' DNA nuclease